MNMSVGGPKMTTCEKCMGEGTLTEELVDGRIIIVECTVCRGIGEIE